MLTVLALAAVTLDPQRLVVRPREVGVDVIHQSEHHRVLRVRELAAQNRLVVFAYFSLYIHPSLSLSLPIFLATQTHH